MSKILIVKGIANCTQCPVFKMDNDGHSTQPVCTYKTPWQYLQNSGWINGSYYHEGYDQKVPDNCPLPDEGISKITPSDEQMQEWRRLQGAQVSEFMKDLKLVNVSPNFHGGTHGFTYCNGEPCVCKPETD